MGDVVGWVDGVWVGGRPLHQLLPPEGAVQHPSKPRQSRRTHDLVSLPRNTTRHRVDSLGCGPGTHLLSVSTPVAPSGASFRFTVLRPLSGAELSWAKRGPSGGKAAAEVAEVAAAAAEAKAAGPSLKEVAQQASDALGTLGGGALGGIRAIGPAEADMSLEDVARRASAALKLIEGIGKPEAALEVAPEVVPSAPAAETGERLTERSMRRAKGKGKGGDRSFASKPSRPPAEPQPDVPTRARSRDGAKPGKEGAPAASERLRCGGGNCGGDGDGGDSKDRGKAGGGEDGGDNGGPVDGDDTAGEIAGASPVATATPAGVGAEQGTPQEGGDASSEGSHCVLASAAAAVEAPPRPARRMSAASKPPPGGLAPLAERGTQG